eukprot:scaffold2408_cov279-Chaetoceros_neogracile.AAC.8
MDYGCMHAGMEDGRRNGAAARNEPGGNCFTTENEMMVDDARTGPMKDTMTLEYIYIMNNI